MAVWSTSGMSRKQTDTAAFVVGQLPVDRCNIFYHCVVQTGVIRIASDKEDVKVVEGEPR